jgi:hypothetical protein
MLREIVIKQPTHWEQVVVFPPIDGYLGGSLYCQLSSFSREMRIERFLEIWILFFVSVFYYYYYYYLYLDCAVPVIGLVAVGSAHRIEFN